MKQAKMFSFSFIIEIHPKKFLTAQKTVSSSSKPFWRIQLAAKYSSWNKTDLGQLWEKHFRNHFCLMEKPFENMTGSS